MILNAEARSFQRASAIMKELCGVSVSANTMERICLDAGRGLNAAQEVDWSDVLAGEVTVPEVAVVSCDGGRIRTREPDCGPGVHLNGQGWNETKNAIFVSAVSTVSAVDPEPNPPACFADPKHVAQLTEKAQIKENAPSDAPLPETSERAKKSRRKKKPRPQHKPKRILRTMLSSMNNSRKFGAQMEREARRRRFHEAARKAFVADGLACNWSIWEDHFRDYTPILDFTHAVTYVFSASRVCFGKTDDAWNHYVRWMTMTWRGEVGAVLDELREHQQQIGSPPDDASDDDPRERLRRVIRYLTNHQARMRYDQYRRNGLPTTSAWMESAVKEINHRVKGTERFWNNPEGAEAILQIRAAALSDDGRLSRYLAHRPGRATVRPPTPRLALAH